MVRQLPAGVSNNVTVSSDEGSAATESIALTVGQQAQLIYSLCVAEEVLVVGRIVEVAETAIGPTAVFAPDSIQNSPAINRNIFEPVWPTASTTATPSATMKPTSLRPSSTP